MNMNDCLYIYHLLDNEERSISERLYAMEKRYLIFECYDCLDMFELLELKIQYEYLKQLEQKLLKICTDLQKSEQNG